MKKSNSIKKNAGVVNKFLKKELHGNPKQLYDAASHLILHGGKRLRPLRIRWEAASYSCFGLPLSSFFRNLLTNPAFFLIEFETFTMVLISNCCQVCNA